jgi:hypothetical protein
LQLGHRVEGYEEHEECEGDEEDVLVDEGPLPLPLPLLLLLDRVLGLALTKIFVIKLPMRLNVQQYKIFVFHLFKAMLMVNYA